MKKDNTRTTPSKQRKQLASAARRKRRVAERAKIVEAQLRKRLKPMADALKAQEKTIEGLRKAMSAKATEASTS